MVHLDLVSNNSQYKKSIKNSSRINLKTRDPALSHKSNRLSHESFKLPACLDRTHAAQPSSGSWACCMCRMLRIRRRSLGWIICVRDRMFLDHSTSHHLLLSLRYRNQRLNILDIRLFTAMLRSNTMMLYAVYMISASTDSLIFHMMQMQIIKHGVEGVIQEFGGTGRTCKWSLRSLLSQWSGESRCTQR